MLKAQEHGLAWPEAKVSRCPWLIRMAEGGPRISPYNGHRHKAKDGKAATVGGTAPPTLPMHTPDPSCKPGLSVGRPSRSRCHPAGLTRVALPGEHWGSSGAGLGPRRTRGRRHVFPREVDATPELTQPTIPLLAKRRSPLLLRACCLSPWWPPIPANVASVGTLHTVLEPGSGGDPVPLQCCSLEQCQGAGTPIICEAFFLPPEIPIPVSGVCTKSLQFCLLLRRHGWLPTRLLCPWDTPDKNTRVGCHSLHQGIFSVQGQNSQLLHWQVGSLPLGPSGKPTNVIGYSESVGLK